jgi:hypothetical protein
MWSELVVGKAASCAAVGTITLMIRPGGSLCANWVTINCRQTLTCKSRQKRYASALNKIPGIFKHNSKGGTPQPPPTPTVNKSFWYRSPSNAFENSLPTVCRITAGPLWKLSVWTHTEHRRSTLCSQRLCDCCQIGYMLFIEYLHETWSNRDHYVSVRKCIAGLRLGSSKLLARFLITCHFNVLV